MRLIRGVFILWTALRYGVFSRATRGERLRLALEQLGPIFVKLGQVLSTRADLLAPDIAQELSKLQDKVKPFDGRLAIATIEQSLGQPLEAIFSSFDATPVASASIAQVHFAVLKAATSSQEREVAVKVLRPGIQKAMIKDIRLMRVLAWWAEFLSREARRLKPREVVAEFDKYLNDELDLVREAANASQLKRNMNDTRHSEQSLVLIPEMIWDYCRESVLVMERMNGIPISQFSALRDAGVDLTKLAREGIILFYTQVFRDAFFHADMHPGNIQVSVAPGTFGKFISLDFGIVGSLSAEDQSYLAQNFAAFFNRDYKRVAELHIESGWVPADTRVDELEASVRTVCEPFFNKPLREVSLGLILMRLFQVSRRFKVEIQPQLVLLQKTLLNIEGLGRQLDPDLDLWSVSRPFLQRWMREQFGPKAFIRHFARSAPHYLQLFEDLPTLLRHYLQAKASEHSQGQTNKKSYTPQ